MIDENMILSIAVQSLQRRLSQLIRQTSLYHSCGLKGRLLEWSELSKSGSLPISFFINITVLFWVHRVFPFCEVVLKI